MSSTPAGKLAHAPLALLAVALLSAPPRADDAWTPTTPGKLGSGGLVPVLSGTGPLTAGSVTNTLRLEDAPAGGTAWVIAGLSELAAPFKGGVLGPNPDLVLKPLVLGPGGSFALPFRISPFFPAPLDLWTQVWISDPGVTPPFAASNTLRANVAPAPAPDAGLFPTTRVLLGEGNDGVGSDVALGDLDGDGRDDLVATTEVGLVVSLADERGQFTAQTVFPDLSNEASALRLADADDDGALDVLFVSADEGGLVVLLGDGAGGFGAPQTFPAGAAARGLAVGDFDGDDVLDAVVGNELPQPDGAVTLLRGLGDGGFAAGVAFSVAALPVQVEAGDVDGNGTLDLVALHIAELSDRVSTLLGDGAGGFAAPIETSLFPNSGRMALADLDDDGTLDVAHIRIANLGGGGEPPDDVRVLFGQGDGSFVAGASLVPNGEFVPGDVLVEDLTGDGVNDALIVGSSGGRISLHPGLAGGGFGPEQLIYADKFGKRVVSGDTDGDGVGDVGLLSGFRRFVLLRGAAGGGLRAPSGISLGTRAVDLVDVDVDGHVDVVTAVSGGFGIRYGLGNGDFQVGLAGFDGPTPSPVDFVVTDLDGAGRLDVVTQPGSGAAFEVWLGAPGGFDPPTVLTAPADVQALVAADVTGDGVRDLIVAGDGASTSVSVFVGAGDGSFAAPVTSDLGVAVSGLAAGEFVLGGGNELALVEGVGEALAVHPVAADGTLEPAIWRRAFANQVGEIGAADVDDDGDADLIGLAPSELLVLVGDGLGGFDPPSFSPMTLNVPFGAPPNLRGLTIGDVDADGLPDVLACEAILNEIVVRRSLGDGTFGPVVGHSAGTDALDVAVGDLDEDGQPEIAVVGLSFTAVRALANELRD